MLAIYPPVNTALSYTIPTGIQRIEKDAFTICPYLSSVTIPDDVTIIEKSAFTGCLNLAHIEIPDSVIEIGDFAFSGSGKLRTVTIPANVKTIGHGVFTRCPELYSVEIDTNNVNFSSISGVVFNKSKTKLILFPEGRSDSSYTIPSSVKRIGTCAFTFCPSLTFVVLPEGVTEIGYTAFGSNPTLDAIVIPKSVTTINNDAFFGTDPTIYGIKDSYAPQYAEEHYLPFVEYVRVKLNGKQVLFDQPPIIESGRTLVPFRAILESLDATVGWDGNTQTVTATKNNITISLQIGSNILTKNGKNIGLDVPAKIVNNRTLIPVRAVAEALDATVDWDGPTYTVIITNH